MRQTVTRTQEGQIKGTMEGNIHVFKGIPYAAPPVGVLRWRPPQPVEPWQGIKNCESFSSIPWQQGVGILDFMDALVAGIGHSWLRRKLINLVVRFAPKPKESEDCLYLNVRTPSLEGRLPVMVWLHGGDHQDGSGSDTFYSSNKLPELGVVLVTINYRLGLMGYLCHPELTEESDLNVSGNYGTLDQISALEWVKENILQFGGDPGNVTIFGESAGGESVAQMLTSPLADGLFHRAIMQSPANGRQMQCLRQGTNLYDSAEEMGKEFADKAIDDTEDQISKLRHIPAAHLMKLVRKSKDHLQAYYPVIDGYVLTRSPLDAFRKGLQHKVPLMVGSNKDEGSLIFPLVGNAITRNRYEDAQSDNVIDTIEEEFSTDTERLFELYPGLKSGSIDAQAELVGDDMFGAKAYFYAKHHSTTTENSYLYFFTQTSPLESQTAGAFHAAELPYVFGSNSSLLPMGDKERDLSDKIARYWVNFSRQGDPSENELPVWENNSTLKDQWMLLGENVEMSPIDKLEKYEILNRRLIRDLDDLSAA